VGVACAVPSLPTTTPAAAFASTAASASDAPAGDVEDLARRGFDVQRRATPLEEAHPVLAARDEHGPAAEPGEDAAPGRGELGGPRQPQAGRLFRLELVGREDARPPVEAEGPQLRVDQHRHAVTPGEGQHAPQQPGAHDPLLVVGHDECRDAADLAAHSGDELGLDCRCQGACVLLVGAHHLLAVGHDAGLDCRAPAGAVVDEP
jgi:hypothetical protein